MVDGTFALDGGSERTKWQKRHVKRKARAPKERARRAAKLEAEARYLAREERRRERRKMKAARTKREAKRQARVATVEKLERAAWRKARKAEGYVTPGLPYKDMRGQRFGLLVVVRPGGHLKSGSKRWWVQCDCGSPEKQVSGTNLKQGLLRSCGFYCAAHPREQWHKPEVAKRWAAKRKAHETIRALPVSLKLLQYCRANSHNREEAALLRKVRRLVVWAEIAQGFVWSRDGRRPAYSARSREIVPPKSRR